jgi:single-strand DNA-binding protein
MQKLIVIGNLGVDAEVKNANGKEFISFKVADTSKFTDQKGNVSETTTWINCAMTGDKDTKVWPFLKKGVKVYVEGRPSYRLYSSEKQRCMLVSVDLHVTSVELCGGSSDAVPRQVADANGILHDVTKCYWLADGTQACNVYGVRGDMFQVDENGFVTPCNQQEEQTEQTEQTES